MDTWNAESYLKFEKQRTRPSVDLARSIQELDVKTALDLGCGPGNSTAVVAETFPNAKVIGADNSPAMIEKAGRSHPELKFILCGAADITGKYDLIFSNACLQWIPGHPGLIPFLMEHLNEKGTLAVQVPMNTSEALYVFAQELIDSGRWDFSSVTETNEILKPEEYHDLLFSCTSDFEIWETVYYHQMPSHKALVDWVKSTKLRPFLAVLSEKEQESFLSELLKKTEAHYKPQEDGSIIFRFRRLFFTATK